MRASIVAGTALRLISLERSELGQDGEGATRPGGGSLRGVFFNSKPRALAPFSLGIIASAYLTRSC